MTDSESHVSRAAESVMVAVEDMIWPAIRIIAALFVLWYSGGSTSQARLYSGVIAATVSGVLCYSYLEYLFVSVGTELSMVALYVLTACGALLGMSLGVLLPKPMPGACAGVSLTLMVGVFLSHKASTTHADLYFIIVGPALALIFAGVSLKCMRTAMLALATILVGGGAAASFIVPDLFLAIEAVMHGRPADSSLVSDRQLPSNLVMGAIWVAGAVLSALVLFYRDGHFHALNFVAQFRSGYSSVPSEEADGAKPKRKIVSPIRIVAQFRSGYSSVPSEEADGAKPKRKIVSPNSYQVPPAAAPDAYNMFDPANLPPRLGEYANMVYSACEDLGNFFGFQDSSVRNQAEHLLILLSNNRRYMSSHILPPSVQPPSPIHALHAKVFSNYMKWCRAMRVPPNFSKMNSSMSAPPAVASRVVDLVLFFCIWGEGANIRHMPETMWFLYHKMMEEYIMSEGYTQTRSLYAGYYVDNVVAPIYEIVSQKMKAKGDHADGDKRNYDDINEFFWSRECLRYRYSSAHPGEGSDVENAPGGFPNGPNGGVGLPGDSLPAVTEGLLDAPKTFLEKRSWLRGILALFRIIEWHIVTFYLLAVIAFARELIWGWVYSLHVASGVFWVFNFLYLTWGLLEVWAVYPGIHLSPTAVCGSVFSLTARFLILVYQTLYLMWTFGPRQTEYNGVEADSNFWWWQYVWLSLLCMIPWFLEAVLQFYPAMTTMIYTSQNDYLQSFLNILFPLSRLYVGKEVHESLGHTAVYAFFWITMIAWKLFFSYIFEVYAMVLPTLQLTDDYQNYPDQSFLKMTLLLTMRWFPQFLVYLIDMSIWYAVWQAFAGTSVGFSEHLGDVRDMKDIRQNFSRAPDHFCKKMLSPDAGSRRGSSASFLGNSQSNIGNPNQEGTSLLGADPHRLQSYVNRLLDVRIQKWVMFSAAWNEVVDHFRQEDIISNRERDYLKFSRFEGFSQAIYLPVFQTAGVMEGVITELSRPEEEYKPKRGGVITDDDVFKPILEHVTMRTAVSEVWELGCFIFLQMLGNVHNDDIVIIMNLVLKWSQNGSLVDHFKIQQLQSVMSHFVGLVKVLEKGIGRRKPAKKPRSAAVQKRFGRQADFSMNASSGRSKMRRAVSATSLGSLEQTDAPDLAVLTQKKDEPGSQGGTVIIDALRDQARDKFRAMAHALKGLLKNTDSDMESKDVLDRLTFLLSMENGFLWDDAYASDQLDVCCQNITFKEVLTKVHGLVACHPDDVEPRSQEARRRLTFFVNSLFMDMPDAPSIHDMFSWNVLTPYYSEDVMYSKSDLETRTDALGVSTFLYLQTLFRADWTNFLERVGIQDEEKVWSKKVINETRLWASLRAQTLTRTVNGMMYFEKALRLLANLERLDDDTTNDLMGEKFGYIVSCQVYGNMKKNQDAKADDIDQLMHRYPHLRIAYIDTVRLNRAGASLFYSVLVKSDGRGNIQEIYRVRLPGNPILGEGKPENQNHAMIFSRGEFVQTIDMNQEGYFEEALKMRNALQEFAKREGPLPTTILGLREHIFTGSVSSLANYMALQETSFVTLGQRVLTKPLCIRLHYGHPDVFDKLFFITRGGISKSSKGINLSEDIFAGYNAVIRGGSVGFKEYLQVGKGRDVGMSQIYKFEAKLSQGAAEQSLSRDVYRLCHRLDFFRLLSMYFGGIGHYFSNVLTVLTVYVVVYLMTVLALFGIERIGDRMITPMGTIQMLLGGLGLLQTIPLFATLGTERGWWPSLREILHVFITGGPLHFMFHIQTKANYMAQTILVGGAKYRATGRGFVTQHTPMDEQFRFFASSHLYLGVELSVGLILMGIYTDAGQYFGRTWSLWLASISFLASPFWFNPLTFEWSVVTSDYGKYLRWMRGNTGGASKSWSMWWMEENSFYKTMPLPSKMIFVIKAAIYVLIAEGIRRSDLFKDDTTLHKPVVSITRVLIFISFLLVLGRLYTMNQRGMPYPVRRTIGILISIGLVIGIVTVFIEDTNCIRYALAAYYFIGALCLLGLLFGFNKFVKHFYFVHDLVCGHIIFIPIFVLAALQLPHHIQTWLLYHNALSNDVVVSDILRYARRSQEAGGGGSEQNEDLIEQVNELKKTVQKQEQLLASVGLMQTGDSSIATRNPSTDAIASLVSSSSEPMTIQPTPAMAQNNASMPPQGRSVGRAMSMSGLDVWGEMALGDAASGSYQSAEPVQMPQTSATTQGFSFSQPDTMPPR
eukprot:CAMPEP_0197467590 /NCGR_PEP_ID=MMETSP1175-20131217/65644_1 /TAXON_ID=1003142 /ORGANISM="Triceratium dubium, Strain CCMP147" /LENGTH=2205 /DNA_ID=CAMNT_0043003667 /DNA_START=287 /DNA_END=6905 /DNA_ORIENTATION=+